MTAVPLRAAPAQPALERYRAVREASEQLASPLSSEDCQVQSMPDVSPTKWHLAHTSWFFETFLLVPHLPGYGLFDPAYAELFNSYYEAIGDRHPRPERGLLSRPSLETIYRYRHHVDEAVARLLDGGSSEEWQDIVELGVQHEQQHQELILMDIKHVLSCNPLQPAYRAHPDAPESPPEFEWIEHPGGLCRIGHHGGGFAFDNESPRHRIWLEPFRIANRLVTAGEYQLFIDDGGYRRPELWLADGWTMVQDQGWTAPLYWEGTSGAWTCFTLGGRRPLLADDPLVHVSYYEADAFARWSGHRLPTEAEWEVCASDRALAQLIDSAWQWTASPYVGYPGYRPAEGALGEYNGKFMINQMVLRGGSTATPAGHARTSYRNFFPPAARWCLSGIRLSLSKPT